MHLIRRPRSIFVQSLAASVIATSSVADGAFVQLDTTGEEYVLSANRQDEKINLAVSAVANDDSQALALSAMYTLTALPVPGTMRIGPAIRFASENESRRPTSVGLKAVYEYYVPTDFGAVFWLADVSSADSSVLLLGQISLAEPGLSFEASYGQGEDYEESVLAVSKRLGDTQMSARLGYRLQSEALFLGFSYNTY